ncbi:hypothetical protein Pyn_39919 [Prunus yedoensis var. nudiflora]|uniref:Uncharacterized protein n=2 Tax=Prunus yedoensis var. nudiflora TaxID=2094558 RepID=A0A314UJI5_PRUYE|nr:hypothetical protein Pyn_04806 [Prunus yedoensis var. nudiflora]PQM37163.1 hypothetical protein Pyn_39919 [Prunus yedoensis var. nudiflora]
MALLDGVGRCWMVCGTAGWCTVLLHSLVRRRIVYGILGKEYGSAWFAGLFNAVRARQQKKGYGSKMKVTAAEAWFARVRQQNGGLLEYGSKMDGCFWALGVHFSMHACYSDIEVVAHAIQAMHPCLPVEMTRLLYFM